VAAVVRPVWRHVLVPAYRLLAPRVRFVWDRLTPGQLGLELTTALAVAGVGLYVFVAYLVTIASDTGPTGLDKRVLDLVDDLNSSLGVGIAKVVTAFGSLPVTGAFLVIGAILLAVRRRPVELAVLVGSFVAIYVVVHVTKDATHRPRPLHPLTGSSSYAFPSGHAAYSTVYVAMALIAGRVLDRIAGRAALVVAAVVVAGAIGVSRAYLRVHWWSDVLAGWGLGAAIFGALAAIGLVVGYFRNNGGGEPAAAPAGGTAPRT
jgi:undecaprenyl-diphosphatase